MAATTSSADRTLAMNTRAAEPLIGVINAGSSSLKFSFYEGERRILSGQVDGIGASPSASAVGPDGEKLSPPDLVRNRRAYRAKCSRRYCRGPESGLGTGD
jgi:hypothetical protein